MEETNGENSLWINLVYSSAAAINRTFPGVCVGGLPARHTLEPRIYNLESATLETLAGPSQFDERDLSFSLSLSLSGCRYFYAMLCVCCRGVSGEPWMRLVGWRLARQMVASLAGTPAALLPLFCLLALEIFVGTRLAS